MTLSPELLDAFPDEREALRGLAYIVDRLVSNLRLGDEPAREAPPVNPTRRERKAYEQRLKEPPTRLGWKNELSASCVIEIEEKWLPLARLRLGLEP